MCDFDHKVSAKAVRGAIVVIADMLREQGERTVSSIREAGGSASFFYSDVRQPDQS